MKLNPIHIMLLERVHEYNLLHGGLKPNISTISDGDRVHRTRIESLIRNGYLDTERGDGGCRMLSVSSKALPVLEQLGVL